MANKITKRERFESLLTIEAVKADEGLVQFIEHEIELLAKKNSSEKKPTAQQKANEEVKEKILSVMEFGKMYTVTEILKAVDVPDLTNQRVSALLRQMMPTQVERIEEKRKAYFSKVKEEE